ncbi:CsbD family protein [Peterkaempfera bronchialis]|uniref:CsbD family protein n=1 Tax=Peterkaempfera bronchialis TaxID=2126346 RepID=A0A345SVY6_9ACTN|nr:CsbD family protein [Peterkaempfera bronchialis]AXI77891.1 CsbD family protein [Peterkaempfera bronchialis]
MATGDKAENAAQKIKGKAKEAAGKAVGNKKLEAEGHGDQAKADTKQAAEKVKDVFKD